MNPSLLAVDIVVSGTPGVCSLSPLVSAERAVAGKSAAAGNVKQSLVASSDSPVLSGSSQPNRFDKVLAVAKLHSSDGALSGETAPPVSQENQDKPELAAEDCNFLAVQAAGLVQSFDKLRMVSNVEPLAAPVASPVAPVSAFAESTGSEDEAVKISQRELQPQNNPPPLIGMSPPLISMLPDSELSPLALPTPILNVTEPLGSVPLAVESGGEPFPTSLNQAVTSDVTADISHSQLVTNTEQMMGKNGMGFQPVETIGEGPQGAEKLDAASVFARLPIQPWHGLPAREDTAESAMSIAEGMAVPPEEVLASDAPAVSDGQKIPRLGPVVPPASGHTQTISANPEESAFAAGKPNDSKTAARHKTQILSESVDGGDKESINNLSPDPEPQKLNVAEIQVTTYQTKDPNASVHEVNPNLQQILSGNNAQILSQSSPASQTGNTADTAYPPDISFGIRKQILESIHGSLSGGDRQISIRLNPPELGRVFMRFQEHDAQITGVLEVTQTQTRYQIEQVLPQIIRDLQDSGVQIKRLDVVLTEQTDYHASQDQSLRNGWSQQNGSAESGTTGGNKSADVWLTNNDDCQDGLLRHAQVTDGSINILA